MAQTKSNAPSQPLVLTHATVIDMTGAAPKPDMTVVVEGNRIAKIGKSNKVHIPKNAQVVDASGEFLIPGLWDMHVYLFDNWEAPEAVHTDDYFPLFVANGVTGVRDMWTDPDDIKLIRRWKNEIEAGNMIGPRVAVGSSIVDGVPVIIKNSLGVNSPDEAKSTVRMLKNAGAGFIRVYYGLTRESYFAIADEAKREKIPFAGVVPNSVTAVEASNAGQKSIEHLTRMLVACSSKEDKFKNLKEEEWTAALFLEMLQSFSEQKCREVSAVFARNHTWHDPTNVRMRALYLGDDESFKKDERLAFIPANVAQSWFKSTESLKPASRKNRELRLQRYREILRIMHEAGVPILAGSEAGGELIYPGFSLHDELETFIQAGFTPYEALQTATVNPAKYLGMENSLGTIERGKFADLVLLDANPLADISNTRRINAVVANGRYLSREILDKMLSNVKARAKGR